MRYALIFVKKVFIPIIYVFFIFAGILAMLTSAYIEYLVFEGLYSRANSTVNPTLLALIPILIVFVYEVTKIFLHFYVSYIKRGISKGTLPSSYNLMFLDIFRWMLIFISFLCTLIFSLNQLYNPNYDEILTQRQVEYTDKQTTSNKEQVDEIRGYYDKLIEDSKDRLDKLESELLAQEKELTSFEADYNNKNRIRRNLSEIEVARVTFENSKSSFDKKNQEIEDLYSKINSYEYEKKEEVSKKMSDQKAEIDENLDEIAEKLKTDNAVDNIYISNALNAISPVGYSHGVYLFIVILLSLIVSIGLEGIVYCSFSILSEDSTTILKSIDLSTIVSGKITEDPIIESLISAMVMTSILMLVVLFIPIQFPTYKTLMAIIFSYFLSKMFVAYFVSDTTHTYTVSKPFEAKTIKAHIVTIASTVSLAFIYFIITGTTDGFDGLNSVVLVGSTALVELVTKVPTRT